MLKPGSVPIDPPDAEIAEAELLEQPRANDVSSLDILTAKLVTHDGVEGVEEGREVGDPAKDPRAPGAEGKVAAEPDAGDGLGHGQGGEESDHEDAYSQDGPGLGQECQPQRELV